MNSFNIVKIFIYFIYGELGKTSLQQCRINSIIRYWFKTIECSDQKYIKNVFNKLCENLEKYPNKKSWAKSVKTMLANLGFNHVWLYQGVGNKNQFLNIFKQRLKDNFIQNWNNNLSNSSRANTYNLFADFSFKSYLDIITVKKFRIVLSRLRLSSHRLEIETGRWHKPEKIPRSERKCQLCNTLEDVFHFYLSAHFMMILESYILKNIIGINLTFQNL